MSNLEKEIREECDAMAEFLIEKNKAYGNSVGDPIKCFSKADWKERMYTRMDDKISRLINGTDYPGDDDIKDLKGYLILLGAVERHRKRHRDTTDNRPITDIELSTLSATRHLISFALEHKDGAEAIRLWDKERGYETRS